jgi:hypothetical protein
MIRIDMSEYMEKHSVARLTGSPPGYIGYVGDIKWGSSIDLSYGSNSFFFALECRMKAAS